MELQGWLRLDSCPQEAQGLGIQTQKPPPPLPLPIRIPESGCAGHCLGSFANGWGRHALKCSLLGNPLILPAPALRLGTYPSCPVCSHHRMSLSWLERKAEPAPLGSSLLLSFIFTNPWACHLGFSTGFMLREQERSPAWVWRLLHALQSKRSPAENNTCLPCLVHYPGLYLSLRVSAWRKYAWWIKFMNP